MFAHRYGVPCQTCHTIVPRLNAFGERFEAAGFRWPAPAATRGALPVALKAQLAYTSASDPGGLPKAIVDEVELLVMGSAAAHLSYRFEQYAVDGGRPGKTRDAYVQFFSDPRAAWTGSARPTLDLKLGQFTLPLPDDPETQRPTLNHYALYDLTAGANPFRFFDDRLGIDVHGGVPNLDLHLLAVQGHDVQSGLPANGVDSMASLRAGSPQLALTAYRYQGRRPLGPVSDAFTRSGLGFSGAHGKSRASLVVQNGWDSSGDGLGAATRSGGGYLQEEWTFSGRLIGVARYDSANSPDGGVRSLTLSLVARPRDRARLTLEDVIVRAPRTTHTLNAGLLFAL